MQDLNHNRVLRAGGNIPLLRQYFSACRDIVEIICQYIWWFTVR
jgi:hypothetical protein